MKVSNPIKVELIQDHHPEDYEDEWLDAGSIVWAEMLPHGKVYLAKWSDGRNMSGVFNTDATEGVDFRMTTKGW